MSQKQIFPLSKLSSAIENVINTYCNRLVWVKAEIVKLNYYPHTGHCFPELVEKKDGKVIAELRGNIWKINFDRINEKFKLFVNEDLGDDMNVVLKAAVTYHPIYGLALNILDIDPEFTLGELAKQKMDTIKNLQRENVFYKNKQISLALLPKTIALISVRSSKGYLDFLNVIETNPKGYKFNFILFPAVLQGEKAVPTIIAQLERIVEFEEIFDAVAIIRGGGGEVGLSCFDNYELAKTIACYPIPVLTGIGHSTNETVSELVCFKSFITPTKMASFLIEEFYNFESILLEYIQSLKTNAMKLKEKEESHIREAASNIAVVSERLVNSHKNELKSLCTALQEGSRSLIKKEKSEIRNTSNSIHYLNPETILKRGFSITRIQGVVVRDISQLNPGDHLQTQLYNGNIDSIVKS